MALTAFSAVPSAASAAETGSKLKDLVGAKSHLAAGSPGCAPDAPGGDWPALNLDLHNTRNQSAEHAIGPKQAETLAPAWKFLVPTSLGKEANFQSTPIVVDGCVYVSAAGVEAPLGDVINQEGLGRGQWRGSVIYALNADTGQVVWETVLNGAAVGLAEHGGRIYAMPDGATAAASPAGVPEPAGAHAVALDKDTGQVEWVSERLDDGDPSHGSTINSSPVIFTPSGAGPDQHPLLFVPLSIGWGDGTRIPLYFLDATTGDVVKKFFAVSEADAAAGYGGSGIWTTAAFDAKTNHLYAGTSDSEGWRKQHKTNNAIVKIDGDPRRSTFGSVVNAFKGTSEHYDLDKLPGWQNNPICEASAENELLQSDASASLVCLELDIDFGASPNLFVDDQGRTIVAALQKSGVLHVVDTANMTKAWSKLLSIPHLYSNGATGAFDGKDLYFSSHPNVLTSFGKSGRLNWVSTSLIEALAYQPLTTANGVMYTISDLGELLAFETKTGKPLLRRQITIDSGRWCLGMGAGVAVARNTVFAPCDGGGGALPLVEGAPAALVAYRPDPASLGGLLGGVLGGTLDGLLRR